ncbi:hypothetical protein DE146DRAFT_635993 [Phaeosphaeria sp. MPI-PUGE-AT-0046c]|nr:hypothetical protein DE146DRAFT_635993 [Phaeosphaeria sp. MPI-PUGE-AT-0046c]
MFINVSPFSTSSIPSTISSSQAASQAASSSQPKAHNLSQDAITILVCTIPIVAALVLIMAIIHCARRRNKRKLVAQKQADIEKSLKMAQRPVLMIDTDVPRMMELHRSESNGMVQTPLRAEHSVGEVPPVPKVPERVYDAGRPRGWTRNSVKPPGASRREMRR